MSTNVKWPAYYQAQALRLPTTRKINPSQEYEEWANLPETEFPHLKACGMYALYYLATFKKAVAFANAQAYVEYQQKNLHKNLEKTNLSRFAPSIPKTDNEQRFRAFKRYQARVEMLRERDRKEKDYKRNALRINLSRYEDKALLVCRVTGLTAKVEFQGINGIPFTFQHPLANAENVLTFFRQAKNVKTCQSSVLAACLLTLLKAQNKLAAFSYGPIEANSLLANASRVYLLASIRLLIQHRENLAVLKDLPVFTLEKDSYHSSGHLQGVQNALAVWYAEAKKVIQAYLKAEKATASELRNKILAEKAFASLQEKTKQQRSIKVYSAVVTENKRLKTQQAEARELLDVCDFPPLLAKLVNRSIRNAHILNTDAKNKICQEITKASEGKAWESKATTLASLIMRMETPKAAEDFLSVVQEISPVPPRDIKEILRSKGVKV